MAVGCARIGGPRCKNGPELLAWRGRDAGERRRWRAAEYWRNATYARCPGTELVGAPAPAPNVGGHRGAPALPRDDHESRRIRPALPPLRRHRGGVAASPAAHAAPDAPDPVGDHAAERAHRAAARPRDQVPARRPLPGGARAHRRHAGRDAPQAPPRLGRSGRSARRVRRRRAPAARLLRRGRARSGRRGRRRAPRDRHLADARRARPGTRAARGDPRPGRPARPGAAAALLEQLADLRRAAPDGQPRP
jgi:hypothetical protein